MGAKYEAEKQAHALTKKEYDLLIDRLDDMMMNLVDERESVDDRQRRAPSVVRRSKMRVLDQVIEQLAGLIEEFE